MSVEDEDDFLGGMGGIQTMGILNALRTGDPRVDMTLAMCFPFFVRFAIDAFKRLLEFFKMDWKTNPKLHERVIVHKSSSRQWGYNSYNSTDGGDSQNTILIKAINLYLHFQVKLNLREALIDLTSTEDKSASIGRHSSYYPDDDNDDDSRTVVGALSKYRIVQKPPPDRWHNLGKYGNVATEVQLLIELQEQQQTKGEQAGASRSQLIQYYRFSSKSGQAIDAFIDQAYQWYMDELRMMEDNGRYLYEVKSNHSIRSGSGDEDEDNRSGLLYKRYRLSDEKTFASLFFRQKESLLKIVHHFQNRTGKYAIEGYPHKLGILLHGPPGTGKSSLIKALAHFTGRNIINVSLSRVQTNSELMSIFFDTLKQVEGEHVPVKLGFKDVIFVMEDVDAASKVVKRRDGKRAGALVQMDHFDRLPLPKPLWHILLESNEDNCKELVKRLLETSDRLKQEAVRPELMKGIAERVTALPGLGLIGDVNTKEDPELEKIGSDALERASQMQNDQDAIGSFVASQCGIILNMLDNGTEVDDAFVDELLSRAPRQYFAKPPFARDVSCTRYNESEGQHVETMADGNNYGRKFMASDEAERAATKSDDKKLFGPSLCRPSLPDELNLTGLLNVLDGIIDSPGRIVIMTTNHLEHLDPALIRPGRIDKKLILGYMSAVDVVAMLQHYFQLTLTGEQLTRVEMAINGECTESGGADDDCRPQLKLTPAQVEQMTAEHDEIEDMIAALEVKRLRQCRSL